MEPRYSESRKTDHFPAIGDSETTLLSYLWQFRW